MLEQEIKLTDEKSLLLYTCIIWTINKFLTNLTCSGMNKNDNKNKIEKEIILQIHEEFFNEDK